MSISGPSPAPEPDSGPERYLRDVSDLSKRLEALEACARHGASVEQLPLRQVLTHVRTGIEKLRHFGEQFEQLVEQSVQGTDNFEEIDRWLNDVQDEITSACEQSPEEPSEGILAQAIELFDAVSRALDHANMSVRGEARERLGGSKEPPSRSTERDDPEDDDEAWIFSAASLDLSAIIEPAKLQDKALCSDIAAKFGCPRLQIAEDRSLKDQIKPLLAELARMIERRRLFEPEKSAERDAVRKTVNQQLESGDPHPDLERLGESLREELLHSADDFDVSKPIDYRSALKQPLPVPTLERLQLQAQAGISLLCEAADMDREQLARERQAGEPDRARPDEFFHETSSAVQVRFLVNAFKVFAVLPPAQRPELAPFLVTAALAFHDIHEAVSSKYTSSSTTQKRLRLYDCYREFFTALC